MRRFVPQPTTVLVIGLIALATGLKPGRAGAQDDGAFLPDVQGVWQGLFGLNISTQEHRRFEGIVVPPSPVIPPSPIRGTVSASGQISLEARGEAFILEAHGEVSGNLMMLDYRALFGDGSVEEGSLLLRRGNG